MEKMRRGEKNKKKLGRFKNNGGEVFSFYGEIIDEDDAVLLFSCTVTVLPSALFKFTRSICARACFSITHSSSVTPQSRRH